MELLNPIPLRVECALAKVSNFDYTNIGIRALEARTWQERHNQIEFPCPGGLAQ